MSGRKWREPFLLFWPKKKLRRVKNWRKNNEKKTFTITQLQCFPFCVCSIFLIRWAIKSLLNAPVTRWLVLFDVHIVNYKCHNIIVYNVWLFQFFCSFATVKRRNREKERESVVSAQWNYQTSTLSHTHTENNITLNYSKIINNKNVYVKVVIYLWLRTYPSRLQRSSA